ncbi:MAG: extracellular solute-binding protein [Chloroflexota bacterium]
MKRAQACSRRQAISTGGAWLGLGGLMAACTVGGSGGGQPGDQAPPAGTLKAGTKVTVASPGGTDHQEIYQRAMQTFQQRHAGVSAEFVSTAGQNNMEKITAARAAGTPFEVIRVSPNETPTLAHRGLIRTIDDLAKRDKYDLADFFEKCLGQYYWKAKLYALPRGFGNQDVYYNVTMFQSAGIKPPPYDWNARTWTTDEFLDAATRLTRLAGDAGWGWDQGTGLRQWAPWVWIFGGDILNQDGTRCILDQQPAVDGLQFLQDLIYRHRVMPPPSANLNALNAFGGDKLGMHMSIPAQLRNHRRLEGLSWDVAPVPRKATRLTSGGGVAWHLSEGVPDLNAAWELHKWMASKEIQTEECEADVTAPPRKSVLRSACFVDRSRPPKGIDVFVQAPEFVHPDPQALGWSEMDEAIDKGLVALWDGSKTAHQIAQEVVPQVNRILQANAG